MSDELGTSSGNDGENIERVIAQMEVFIGKYRDGQQESPETVEELVRGIKKDLLSIASKPTKLVRKALEVVQSALGAVGNFVSGTGTLPHAVVKRIGGSRALADAREDQKQAN